MPVHPDAQKFLDEFKASGEPALWMQSPAQARARRRARWQASPREIVPVEDIGEDRIPGPHGPVGIRWYRPMAKGLLPVLVYFHGGGWVLGDLDQADSACRLLARATEAVVVSVDYHLAPEYRFPVQVEEAWAALAWVKDHASQWGARPDRLAVGGDSAGGNLAAVVPFLSRERQGPTVHAAVLVYPVTDATCSSASYRAFSDGYFLTKNTMQWFWEQYLPHPGEGKNPLASPARRNSLDGAPPTIIVTAEYDPLRDEGEEYGQRLLAAGVSVCQRRMSGMIHGFFTNEWARDGRYEAMAWIGRHFRALMAD